MKYSKITRFLVGILLPALLVISLPARPARAAEAITLSASQGAIGQQISITGSGFATSNVSRGVNILFGESQVSVGGTMDYAAVVYQKMQIAELASDGTFNTSFTVPATLGSGNTKKNITRGTYYVFVTYYYPTFLPPDGTTIVEVKPFKVVAGLVTISPDNGPVGTEVTISGTFFGETETMSMNYDGTAIAYSGGTSTDTSGAFGPAKITIPAGAGGTHVILVTGATSSLSTQVTFTVKPKLAISPTSGAAGQLITATGSGFGNQADVSITFGGVAVTPTRTDVNGNFTTILPALPRPAGSYDIVFSDGAGNLAQASFTLTTTTLSVSPASARVGSAANVSGSNFLPSKPITITLNDIRVASATSTGQGAFSATFTVPAMSGGTYKIRASDGTNNNTADFAVISSLQINPKTTAASPGYVGSEVTISGAGFAAGATVAISYDGATVATTTAAGDKTYSATFKVPPSRAGEHTIIASDGTGAEQITFVVESTPPPTPAPLKPEMGIKASPKAAFDWQDATDPSGVTYTLQVATTPDFAANSIVIEKEGLAGSQYAIPAEQPLQNRSQDSPYYWRVRAVDGAGNQSLWSGTGIFYVGGGLPQVVIYFLIGIGALALILFAFWLGKRTASF